MGPDGAGKTTTLRLLSTAMTPSEGRASVAGYDVLSEAEQVKAHVGYLAQRFSLYDDLTVGENLRFFADLYGVPRQLREEREERLLAFTGLSPFRDRLAQHLSGGMRQKLALATALLHDPQVLLLDEPTTGVDPVSRREFWRILSSLRARRVTALYATPYMDEAERCDQVVFLAGGRVLAQGTCDELRALVRGVILEALTPSPRPLLRALATARGVEDVQAFGDKLHVRVAGESAAAVVAEAVRESGLEASAPAAISPSLEDVFMYLTRRRGEAGQGGQDERRD